MKIFRLLIIPAMFLFSCAGQAGHPSLEAVEKHDSCALDPPHSYEVYIPARADSSERLPLLLILDPHGNGAFALEHFKAAANNYPFLLVASNRVRNNFPDYIAAISTLVSDVKAKYPVGQNIYLAGFSGGARMALNYALEKQGVDGLILCGALAGPDYLEAVNIPVVAVTGTDDFNFTEAARYLLGEQQIPAKLRLILTSDSHGWPDSAVTTLASAYLFYSGLGEKEQSERSSDIQLFCRRQLEQIDSLQQEGEVLQAAMLARNLSISSKFTNTRGCESPYAEITEGTAYRENRNRLEKAVSYELSVRQPYLAAFSEKDTSWWRKEITRLDAMIARDKDPLTNSTYKRIRAFLGIACYSQCRQSVRATDPLALQRTLAVYGILEPENPDRYYFSAFPLLWKKQAEDAATMLQKALDAGFSEKEQLKADFPASVTSLLHF